MRRAFNDAEVEGWEALEGTFGLPDEDDEHVVAAVVVGGAGVIVTSNISDFPAKAVPPAIQIVNPRTSPPTPSRWTRCGRGRL